MLIRTGWKGALCALVVSSVACSDAASGSQQSPNIAEEDADVRDAGLPDAGSTDAAIGGMKDAASDPPPSAADAATKGSGAGDPVRNEPWRIVVLGDSITEGSCTSQLVWQNLRDAGVKNIDMVGTNHSTKECGVADADRDNEGHSGYRATDLVDDGPHAAELTSWCKADKGDVVLMHLGTNDIWHANSTPATILGAFSKILQALRAVQPKVVVFVAQILPMTPPDCSDCGKMVPLLNAEIPAWATRESQADSPVYVVDQFTGFDTKEDTSDGVHPTDPGAKKMADKWSAALLHKLKL